MKKNSNALKLGRIIVAVLLLAASVTLQFRLVKNKITERLDNPWVIVISLFLGLLLLAISIKSVFDDMPNGTSGPSPAERRKYVRQICILFGVIFLICGLWNFRSNIPFLKDFSKDKVEIVEETPLSEPESQQEEIIEEEQVVAQPEITLEDSLENAKKILEDISEQNTNIADSINKVSEEKKRQRTELDLMYCRIDSLKERQRILSDQLANIRNMTLPASRPCNEPVVVKNPKPQKKGSGSTTKVAKGGKKKVQTDGWNGFTARATKGPQGNH